MTTSLDLVVARPSTPPSPSAALYRLNVATLAADLRLGRRSTPSRPATPFLCHFPGHVLGINDQRVSYAAGKPKVDEGETSPVRA
jgi:hypothetical protein